MSKDQQKLEERFVEMYSEGYRTSVILAKLTEEFGYSEHTLYKRLYPIEKLKKLARSSVA